MGIYKNINVTHDVSTYAEDNTDYPRISYTGNEPSFPLEIISKSGASVCMSLDEATVLVHRLSTFISTIVDIDKQHDKITSLISCYQKSAIIDTECLYED
jgi:hypothetical protein